MISRVASMLPAVDIFAHLTIHNILYDRKVKWHTSVALRGWRSVDTALAIAKRRRTAPRNGRRRADDRGARHQCRHARWHALGSGRLSTGYTRQVPRALCL